MSLLSFLSFYFYYYVLNVLYNFTSVRFEFESLHVGILLRRCVSVRARILKVHPGSGVSVLVPVSGLSSGRLTAGSAGVPLPTAEDY